MNTPPCPCLPARQACSQGALWTAVGVGAGPNAVRVPSAVRLSPARGLASFWVLLAVGPQILLKDIPAP